MRHLTIAALAAAAMLTACGGDDNGGGGKPSGDLPQGSEPAKIDPADFTANVDNRYWPMKPGTRWISREVDADGTKMRVVVTATSATKKLANGVTARVMRDTVSESGKVVEDTFDWYAQDTDGNVWYMGEDTAEFENGKVATRAGSFEAGVDGAQPGIAIPAKPADDVAYRQEYYKGHAEDAGEILSVGEQVEVPAGHFRDAVLTRDTNPLEPKVLELKMYAPGVGPVLELGIAGDRDRAELLAMKHVGRGAAAAAGTTPLGKPY